jgi:hypothetical protein
MRQHARPHFQGTQIMMAQTSKARCVGAVFLPTLRALVAAPSMAA